MSEDEVIAVMEERLKSVRRAQFIPLMSEDSDKIMAYCLSRKEASLGCPDCILKKRYGRGERCPIVVTLAG